jgi:voltage-gated potassium channel Kch
MSGLKGRTLKKGKYGAGVLFVCTFLTVGAGYVLAAEKKAAVIDNFVFGRAEALLVAINNTMISLAVDTERASIDIAKINQRLGQLERRVVELEQQLAAARKD